MYSKKHIFYACLITFIITSVCASVGHNLYSSTNEDVLVRAKNIILDQYVDELSEEQIEKLDDFALTAMVASLDDPYSYYLNVENMESFDESNEEEYVGIGVNIEYYEKAKKIVIISPTPESPAEKAGILPMDEITGADNLTVMQHGVDAVIDHIKNGVEGDMINIHIMRDGGAKTLKIRRSKIVTKTIFHEMLDENVGYIRITQFKHNSVADFNAAIKDLQEKQAKSLIIDLRNNPGGYADSVLKMTDTLLPKGTIAYLENNKGRRQYFESDAKCLNIPMAVLINEGTASAAELMAGSLKAYEKATIIGKKSYGKAVGQLPIMLTDKTAIYLTDSRYYTPKGECIDKVGIKPDVEVDLPEELAPKISELTVEEDPQLKAAMEAVYKEMTK